MTFERLLSEEVKKAIVDMGFTEMTDVQRKSIDSIMEGKDVIVRAQTGSGKTLAFGIPIVTHLHEKALEALILTPTRELANQVTEEMKKLAKYKKLGVVAVYGGVSMENQVRAIHHGANVVIGTPGRIIDLMNRGVLNFSRVKIVVLDEADRMLDMGFIDDITLILSRTPKDRQTVMLSATMPDEIKKIANRYMRHTVQITVHDKITVDKIEQFYAGTAPANKFDALCKILKKEDPPLCLIFANTKHMVSRLTDSLKHYGFQADGLHGNLTQSARDKVMEKFKGNHIKIMVATDVAARGVDINDISHVINIDAPDSYETYVHRIGRTGRIGKKGISITILTNDNRRIFDHMKMGSSKLNEYPLERSEPQYALQRSTHEHSRSGGFRSRGRSSGGGFRRRRY